MRAAFPEATIDFVTMPLAAQAPRAGNVAASRTYATSAPATARLAARIDSVLARPHLAGARWGIEVRDAATLDDPRLFPLLRAARRERLDSLA